MIPLATTTIAIYRERPDQDPYDRLDARPIARGVRAAIGSPSGSDHHIGGHQEITHPRLTADPCDLRHTDTIIDETTGDRYGVNWLRHRPGLGLDHVEASLHGVEGASNG